MILRTKINISISSNLFAFLLIDFVKKLYIILHIIRAAYKLNSYLGNCLTYMLLDIRLTDLHFCLIKFRYYYLNFELCLERAAEQLTTERKYVPEHYIYYTLKAFKNIQFNLYSIRKV